MTRARARELVHDVGKQVARTARNLTAEEASRGTLASMLLADLYALRGERASARFERLAQGLAGPRLDEVRARFARVDALEAAARAGEGEALAALVDHALAIEAALRAFAREVA